MDLIRDAASTWPVSIGVRRTLARAPSYSTTPEPTLHPRPILAKVAVVPAIGVGPASLWATAMRIRADREGVGLVGDSSIGRAFISPSGALRNSGKFAGRAT